MTISETNKKIKIFLAEDEEMIQRMYLTKFKAEGFDIIAANNGEEALKLIPENKPDIILLDIIMPLLDGFSVLRKLKADEKTKNIPVIMLTNLAQDSDRKLAEELKAVDFLIKSDNTPTQVVEKIKAALNK